MSVNLNFFYVVTIHDLIAEKDKIEFRIVTRVKF